MEWKTTNIKNFRNKNCNSGGVQHRCNTFCSFTKNIHQNYDIFAQQYNYYPHLLRGAMIWGFHMATNIIYHPSRCVIHWNILPYLWNEATFSHQQKAWWGGVDRNPPLKQGKILSASNLPKESFDLRICASRKMGTGVFQMGILKALQVEGAQQADFLGRNARHLSPSSTLSLGSWDDGCYIHPAANVMNNKTSGGCLSKR